MRRYELTDEQWRRLQPLLPPERPRTGRPNHDHRTVLNGILWVLRTGAPTYVRAGSTLASSKLCQWGGSFRNVS